MTARNDFLIFGAPDIGEPELQAVMACLRSGWIGTGPRVRAFEESFRHYKDASYAVAVNSCTAALHLSMIAAGLKLGDEVITTPLTFCATINAIIHAGLTPVLADVTPETMNIAPHEIERHITPRTRAILPVHFAGRPCNMDPICDIARRYNLKLIEDCAHAVETEYHGRKAGTFGDFGCFSFYVTKNITTAEGGMVLTSSEDSAARIGTLALHGMTRDAWKRFGNEGYTHYDVVECGFKYNMTDLQAAIGIHQLARVEDNWAKRAKIWNAYHERLADLPVQLPSPVEPQTRHGYHLFTILIDESKCGLSRDEFLSAMTANRIGVGAHYLSIPEHSYYQKTFGWKPDDYPNAMRIGRQTASLPLSSRLSDSDVEDVISTLEKILGKQSTSSSNDRPTSSTPSVHKTNC